MYIRSRSIVRRRSERVVHCNSGHGAPDVSVITHIIASFAALRSRSPTRYKNPSQMLIEKRRQIRTHGNIKGRKRSHVVGVLGVSRFHMA